MLVTIVTLAVLCSTGRKTVTVDDLLHPDAPFVQRVIRVCSSETCDVVKLKNIICTYKATPNVTRLFNKAHQRALSYMGLFFLRHNKFNIVTLN